MARTKLVQPALPDSIDLTAVRSAVDACLSDFLREKAAASGGRLAPKFVDAMTGVLATDSRRLRPVLCVLGYAAAGKEPDPTVITASASLELHRAFTLTNEDLVGGSQERRGAPSVHRELASHYLQLAIRRGDTNRRALAGQFGLGGAILVGNMAMAWSNAMLNAAGLTAGQLTSAHEILDEMRAETIYGQWMDLHTVGRPETDVQAPLSAVRYRARYTCERPLHLGAVLAGADRQLLKALSDFALPVGEAARLCEDLLAVGTGSPALADLRVGKRTVLLATTMGLATTAQRRTLKEHVGNRRLDEQGLAEVRQIMVDSGAFAAVQSMIRAGRAAASDALRDAPMSTAVVEALQGFADSVTA